MIGNILLPTDGSTHAERTIGYAVELAKLSGARIVAMYAYNPEFLVHSRQGALAMEAQRARLELDAKARVSAVAERLRAEGIDADALAVEGPPAEAILHAIQTAQPDLVVMGSHGGDNLLRALGSTAEAVVRASPVTVTIVK